MNLFLKIFLISFFVFIIGFSIVQAGSSDLFSGFAWSENIGWISFNSVSDGSSYDYGVTFSEASGIFNGYAWSENIGWISFNVSDLGGCPSGTCQAHIATSTNKISGWGRALSYGDGWDGWLNLDPFDNNTCDTDENNYVDIDCGGDNITTAVEDYQITRNTSTQELEGYAWGGSVIGWVSFNCSDDSSCASFDYSVDIYGADIIDPYSYIYSPASGSWYLDDFTIYITDEDPGGSGIDNDECKYKIFNYDNDVEQSVSIWHSRTCNSSVGITADAGSSPDGCWVEDEDSCNIYVRSKDMAGNEYVNTETSYSIDFTAPIPGELYDAANPEAEEPIEVTEGVIYTLKSDIADNLKVASCALFINGVYQSNTVSLTGSDTAPTASVEYQFTSSGSYHNNYMKCRDAAGNTSTGEPMTFFTIIPTTSPVITSLTAYSSHCDTPSTECTSQYGCCMDYTTQTDCCVKFNVSAYDPEDLDLNYSWTFGDSGTSTDEDPHHHYSTTANPHTVTVTVSNGTEQSQQNTEVVVTDPTLSVNLSAIPSFGSTPLNDVDLRSIVSGTMFGNIDYWFDCTNDSIYDVSALDQSDDDYTYTNACNYTATTTYTAKTKALRGTSTGVFDTVEVIVTGGCVYNSDPELNATTTCVSSQGCGTNVASCEAGGTWSDCLDDCIIGDTQSCGTGGEQTCSASCAWGTCVEEGECTSDFDCYCPLDSCSEGNYYNYPIYGSCANFFCNVGTAIGSPCEPDVDTSPDNGCNTPPICNSLTPVPSSGVGPLDVILTADAVDDDGNITHYEFNFGDGTYTEIVGNSVGHTYAEPATASTTYTAEVRARDDDYDWSTVNAQTDIIVTKNIPPVALLSCDTSSCGIGSSCDIGGTSIVYNQNCQFIFTNESTDADSTDTPPNDHIVQSVWSIFYDGGTAWYDPYDTYTGTSTMDSLTLPTGMPISLTYYMLLEVEDAKGATATTSADFYMRREIVSSFQCSLDPGEEKVWKTCNGLSVSEDETVYLKDLSVASEIAGGGTATIQSWDWTFTGGTPGTSSLQEPTVSFEQGIANTGKITLVVTDSAERIDTTSYNLIITIPLPEWQEIAPI